jgi:hypothetical protein
MLESYNLSQAVSYALLALADLPLNPDRVYLAKSFIDQVRAR